MHLFQLRECVCPCAHSPPRPPTAPSAVARRASVVLYSGWRDITPADGV